MGAQPAMEVLARGNAVTIIDHQTKRRQQRDEADPMEVCSRQDICRQLVLFKNVSTDLVLLAVCFHAVFNMVIQLHMFHAKVAVRLSESWRPVLTEGLPSVFTGGWVGYCGYDTVRYVYSGVYSDTALPSQHMDSCMLPPNEQPCDPLKGEEREVLLHSNCRESSGMAAMQASCRFRAPRRMIAACRTYTWRCTTT